MFTAEDLAQVIFEGDCIYQHATAKFHYTTYDLRRGQDTINSNTTKNTIMVSSQAEPVRNTEWHPFWYARVHGIYHANISHYGRGIRKQRVDFLWVRWMGEDPEWRAGDKARRLDRVGFVPYDGDTEPFGFVNPSHVIRASHIIPAFSCGKTFDLLPNSKFYSCGESGDWVNFYVNR